MPITIPPFVAYQAPLFPLRGLWNHKPPEGDRFVSAEIDWGVTTGLGMAVAFTLAGNSPMEFSQIVAVSIDNSQCASDVALLFPDTAFVLDIPAYNQGVYPVFTNALSFYASAEGAGVGDRTVLQILNSLPPPVAIQASIQQQHASAAAIPLQTNGNTQIIPLGVSGTLTAIQVIVAPPATSETCNITLIDGTGRQLWFTNIESPASGQTLQFTVSPIALRFFNGVVCNISFTSATGGYASVNLYYSLP